MKKIYIGINIFLVLMIVISLVVQPKHKNISIDKLSKSITTSSFKAIEYKKEDVREKKEEKPTNNITESVVKVEENISTNIVKASVESDVLEKQVGPMSAYGPDCAGCSGRLATGHDARGGNITYQDKTYGKVRIVAGDRKYPFGTIVRISGTSLGTFNAIVMDRGGDIGIGNKFYFDLLCTSNSAAMQVGSFRSVTFEILRYGY